jgi:hypothetical protein
LSQKIVRIHLEFAVRDEELLQSFVTPEMADLGLINMGELVAEVLFHSNPGVKGYLDYGVELLDSHAEER